MYVYAMKIDCMPVRNKIKLTDLISSNFPSKSFQTSNLNDYTYAIVSQLDCQYVGCCLMKERVDGWVLDSLCVKSNHRNKQIGSEILEFATNMADGKSISLYVDKGDNENRLQSFYEKRNYTLSTENAVEKMFVRSNAK